MPDQSINQIKSLTSAFLFSPQAQKLSLMLITISYKPGKIFTKVLIKGATANSMKPICMLHNTAVARSIIGDTGRPSLFSRSPWEKNSYKKKGIKKK